MRISKNIERVNAKTLGPRRIGGTYVGGYWRHTYTVTGIGYDADGLVNSITVRCADGTVNEHCTSWDTRKDREVVS